MYYVVSEYYDYEDPLCNLENHIQYESPVLEDCIEYANQNCLGINCVVGEDGRIAVGDFPGAYEGDYDE